MPQRRRKRPAQPRKGRAAQLVRPDFTATARSAVRRYGPAIATMAGGALTKALMSYVKGFGDYNLSSNTIMGMQPPEVHNSSNSNSVIISHREFLTDITATTGFNVTNFIINPGNVQTFPWLSQIGTSFEQYRLRGLIFMFNSMSSPNVLAASATTALGSVVMATQYDVEDPVFASKFEMENYSYANSRVPYISFIHPVECARNLSVLSDLYIRDSSGDPNTDARFYDFGRFAIATTGMQANSGVIGELWVTYEIELMKPKILAGPASIPLIDAWNNTGAVTGASPCGTPGKRSSSNLGTILSGAAANIFSFPANLVGKKYIVYYCVNGTSVAIVAPSFTFAGFSALTILQGNSTAVSDNTASTSTTYLHFHVVTQINSAASLTIGTAGTLPGGGGNTMDLWIMVVPPGLTSTFDDLCINKIKAEEWDDEVSPTEQKQQLFWKMFSELGFEKHGFSLKDETPIRNFSRKLT